MGFKEKLSSTPFLLLVSSLLLLPAILSSPQVDERHKIILGGSICDESQEAFVLDTKTLI